MPRGATRLLHTLDAGGRVVLDACPPDTARDLIDRLQGQLDQRWRFPSEEDFHRFFRDGVRQSYDRAVEADHARLSALVLLAWLRPTADVVDEVLKGLSDLLRRRWWHLPAHERDRPDGLVLAPTTGNRSIDMVSAETAALIAWSTRLLGNAVPHALAEGLRERVTHEVLERYVHSDAAFIELATRPTNWTPWVGHQVLVAATLMDVDPALAAAVEARVRRSLRRYVTLIAPDGGIEEGFSYWWQGAAHLADALEWFGPDADRERALRGLPQGLLLFPLETVVDHESALTFSDAERKVPQDLAWQLVHRWAHDVGDEQTASRASALARTRVPLPDITQPLERSLRSLVDQEWLTGREDPAPVHTVGASYPSIGLHTARRGRDPEWLLGVTAGHNDQLHNHVDVGGFSVWVGGGPVVIDPGAPTYDGRTFGPERHTLPAVASSWHSVPSPDGLPQKIGASARPSDVEVSRPADGSFTLRCELGSLYAVDGLRWTRTFTLDGDPTELRVRDEWDAGTGAALVGALHLIVPRGSRVTRRGVVVPLPDRDIVLTVEERVSVEVEPLALDDRRLSESWGEGLVRLVVRSHGPQTAGSLTVRVQAAGRGPVASAAASGEGRPRHPDARGGS